MKQRALLLIALQFALLAVRASGAERLSFESTISLLQMHANTDERGSLPCASGRAADGLDRVNALSLSGRNLMAVSTATIDAAAMAACALASKDDHPAFAAYAAATGEFLAMQYVASVKGKLSDDSDIVAAHDAQALLTWCAFVYPEKYSQSAARYRAMIVTASKQAAHYNATHRSDRE